MILEEADLPPGLRTKLSTMRAIEACNYANEAQLYVKLLENERLEECKDTEGFQIHDTGLVKYNDHLIHNAVADTVERMGFNAFEGCDSVISIDIPRTVRMIGKYAFCSAENLQTLEVEDSNPLFSSAEGVLYNRKGSMIIQFPAA